MPWMQSLYMLDLLKEVEMESCNEELEAHTRFHLIDLSQSITRNVQLQT